MPVQVPPINADGSLREFTADELDAIDLKRRGVEGAGDHFAEELGPDGSGTPRLYSCAWAERYAAAYLLVGYAVSYVDGFGRTRISRALPDTYGGTLEMKWVCTKVKIDPWRYLGTISAPAGTGLDAPDFTRAYLAATYELVPYVLRTDATTAYDQERLRYVVAPGAPGAEIATETHYIQMPGGIQSFTTADGTSRPAGVPVPYSIGIAESYSKKRYVWKRVPRDLWGPGKPLTQRVKGDGVTRGYIGSLNLTTFFDHPPLTLKLEGVEERLLPDPLGFDYAWEIHYLVSEKNTPFGHLGLYWFETDATSGADSGYYQVQRRGTVNTFSPAALVIAGDETAMSPLREFNDLFVVGDL